MLSWLSHVRDRRRTLKALMADTPWETLEESCVPSYVHASWPSALTAWWRLFAARDLHKTVGGLDVVDFGAGSGELRPLLPEDARYTFIEELPHLVDWVHRQFPTARRLELDDLPADSADTIYALDSLEHCDDPDAVIRQLARGLRPGGHMIISGPTENALYRLGRRLSGFSGHYHHHTVYDVERDAARYLERRAVRTGPVGVPLFRVSLWTKPKAG